METVKNEVKPDALAKREPEPQTLATVQADELPLAPATARRLGIKVSDPEQARAANRANAKAIVGALKGDYRERLVCYRLAEMDDIIEQASKEPSSVDPIELSAARKYKARNAR